MVFRPVTPEQMYQGILKDYWEGLGKPLIDSLNTSMTDAQLIPIISQILLICRSKDVGENEFIYNDWYIPDMPVDARACTGTTIDISDDRSMIWLHHKRILTSALALDLILKNESAERYLNALNVYYTGRRTFSSVERNDMINNIKEVGAEIYPSNGIFDQIIVQAEAGNWRLDPLVEEDDPLPTLE